MASVYTVSQVTAYIRNMFTQDFALNRISIRGEVSNCKYHTSGHIYFTLKDGGAQIAAVMFAGQRKGLDFELQEGQEVTVSGTVDVYERDGRYQLYAKEITREGKGDLFRRFEKLRNELEEMGMFDSCYKQPIPRYARKVGIVTAGTGAAIRDIMNISARRNPYVQLILYPALVQGEQAKYSIAKGIETLDRMGLDVLIVGRGGGSIEDLWAFNEEMVARAIFNCTTPIISAVGHETDVTIADYVADLRAPTPSAAAELAVFDYSQFTEQVNLYRQVLERSMERRLEKVHFRLDQCGMRLKLLSPQRQLNDRRQRLADMESRLGRMMEEQLGDARLTLEDRKRRLEARMAAGLTEGKHRLALLSGRLDGLSPLKKLGGGYGFVTDAKGRAFTSIAQAGTGDTIRISVKDGRVDALVTNTESMKLPGSEG
ncbi:MULTISPECIES: exodeoxyribonuclease VII large subunit [unclassified Clostridium]|uniref:exodeoxyribonuclease VII large subunit n=1 Tax=unclassified Clostridium TaxID=2614128 RepID=UPI001105A250|nr:MULTISPECIES: exodeoxyribonuclease VII large subunit [unclassified Clostridium]